MATAAIVSVTNLVITIITLWSLVRHRHLCESARDLVGGRVDQLIREAEARARLEGFALRGPPSGEAPPRGDRGGV
jgi:hypothetical protein